jgi:hypothetical protein
VSPASIAPIPGLRPHAVRFTETGELRVLTGLCLRCGVQQRDCDHFTGCTVSPAGVIHFEALDGDTLCGHDATGERWWWPE